MSKINYIIREDSLPKMITGESDFDFLETEKILENYPYIVKSMEKEEYYLENEMCFVFDELVYENKVVGFATYEFNDETVLMLTECYIMPEFRGNRIFFNELCKIIFSSSEFGILQPTRNLVELLIDYSFARNVTDEIVASGIEFYFDEFDARSNKKDGLLENIPFTNFYDLKICSSILINGNEVIYHNLLENDLKRHGKRKKLKKNYFKNITELFKKNEDEFEYVVIELEDNLPQEKLGYDEIIGNGEYLSEFMQDMVDNKVISYNQAVKIREELIRKYNSGEITDETIEDEFTMMIINEASDITFEGFQEFLNSTPDDGKDKQALKQFFDIVGDDEKLGEEILKAMITDDEIAFQNLILNAIENNEELYDNLIDLAYEMEDDDEMEVYNDEVLDIESLGLNLGSPYHVGEMWESNDEKYKLDNTFYGKEYPITYDIYIFRVLKSLKKHNNLKIALAAADMDGVMTSYVIESHLFMQEFVSAEVNYDNWDEFANDSLTVKDLKNILRKNNLKTSGKKQDLIDRVAENQIPLDEFKSKKVRVTAKGDEFIHNNLWIDFYENFLDKFDFNDFMKYLDTNEGEFIEITLGYLEKHLKKAKKENDSEYISDCITAQDMISENGENYLKQLYE